MATSPKSRGRKSAAKNAKEVVEEVPEETPAEEEEEEDDEEGYEVEEILDARWAYNKRGKWSYYVHWKGYGAEEDMWIDEEDAGGAHELIQEWHRKHELPIDGKGKKKPAAKKGRPSASTATKDKKRKASSTDGMEVDTPEAEEPPAKKTTKRSAKPPPQASPEPEVEEEAEADAEDAEPDFAPLDDILTKARWDTVVKSIETVEAGPEGLTAFFIRDDGKKSKCSTTILAERCPQLLINFYEGHLKWRPNEEDD